MANVHRDENGRVEIVFTCPVRQELVGTGVAYSLGAWDRSHLGSLRQQCACGALHEWREVGARPAQADDVIRVRVVGATPPDLTRDGV